MNLHVFKFVLSRAFLVGCVLNGVHSYIALEGERVSILDNFWAPAGFMEEFRSRNAQECLGGCDRVPGCLSIYFSQQTRTCQLHAEVFDTRTNLVPAQQTKYYKKKGISVASNFTCPLAPPDLTYNTVKLSDGTVFRYRPVWSLADKPTAMANCAADGAGLVRVLTAEKMNVLLTLLTTCPGYAYAGDFWVSGSNSAATNFFDISQWKTPLGEVLPATSQFWGPGEPTVPDVDHSVVMWAAHGYKWKSIWDTYTNYYFCEK